MTNLREARKQAGLRRNFVADKLRITPDHLNLLERGKSNLSPDKIEILAKLYKLKVEEMVKIANEARKNYIDKVKLLEGGKVNE